KVIPVLPAQPDRTPIAMGWIWPVGPASYQYMSYVLNVMSRLKVTGKRMRAGRAQRVGRQGENGGMHNDCYARGKYDTAILCAAQRKMHYLGDCPDLFWRILLNQFVSCLHLVRFFMLRAALRGATGI